MLENCRIPLFVFLLSLAVPATQAQTAGLMDRAFFYNDIYQFTGTPYATSPFGEIHAITQIFETSCSNLNRLIIPLYVKEGKGWLVFNLYQVGQENDLVFSTTIDIGKLPLPSKIGTHYLEGVLYNVWIPPQANSKNTTYLWELKNSPEQPAQKVGIFLTRTAHPRLQTVSIDAVSQEGAYSAFYAYCAYRFDWKSIVSTTLDRLMREKMFLVIFLALQGGLVAGIVKRRK